MIMKLQAGWRAGATDRYLWASCAREPRGKRRRTSTWMQLLIAGPTTRPSVGPQRR